MTTPAPAQHTPHAAAPARAGGFSFGTFLVGVIVGLVVGLFAGVVVLPLLDSMGGKGAGGTIINSSAPVVRGGSELKPGETPAEPSPPSDEERARTGERPPPPAEPAPETPPVAPPKSH
ncbi:MAG: hypothetical protein ACKVS8_10835 [Phycisphaerales bacterium]